jgi:alanyl-tRNA synthetase
VGDLVTCRVDYERRGDMAKNHTATHLLNFALRKVVAADVDQKGSVVTPDRLRFDFNSQKQLPVDKLLEIEQIVRKQLRESLPVHTKVVPLADAMRISSLRAVFGETYPDPVRVVSCGPSVDELLKDPLSSKWAGYSVELCGGTHLKRTGDARAFSIVQETAVAKGIRRVICVTGDAAFTAASDAEALRARLEAASRLPAGKGLAEENKALAGLLQEAMISVTDKHELNVGVEQLARKLIAQEKEALQQVIDGAAATIAAAQAKQSKFVVVHLPGDGSWPSKVNGELKKSKKIAITIPFLIVQANAEDNTVWFAATVPSALSQTYSAKDWVEQGGAMCEVQGGGTADNFNGKGSNAANAEKCVRTAEQLAKFAFP